MKKINNISIIVTILNEENTILSLLNSIKSQTLKSNEIIIIDGGSSDKSVLLINSFVKNNPKLNIKIKIKEGNRSIGRNYAIKISKNNLIAITDAGCTLDKNWLKELVYVYKKSNSPVIAGYYSAGNTNKKPLTSFQKAVVPYALVMPDKVNPETFLPATRSMLIEKKTFLNSGGFNEKLNDNEDFAFAHKIKNKNIKISFAKKAIAFWQPRNNVSSFYNMIFRFARGDVFAGIVRPKVILIFVRYFIFGFLFLANFKLFLATICFYTAWSIQKNKKYVDDGWIYLPVLQFTSDVAVMHGSVIGFLSKFSK